jgi:chromosome segregation ATPase
MKTTFNKLFVFFVALLVLGAATLAYAENENTGSTAKEKATDNFCLKILDLSSKVDQMITEKIDKLDSKRSERDQGLGVKRAEIDQKLGENRQKWDSNRAEHYTKLQEKADTDAKKQALLNFISAVDTAIANRRAAVNAAQDTFRNGINQLLASREIKVDQITADYKKAIEDAVTKAKSDCSDSSKSAAVRQALKDALRAARQEFTSDKQAIDKLGEQVKALTDARKAAFEKAKADFTAAMDKAKAVLKTAFGELKSSPVPSQTPQL